MKIRLGRQLGIVLFLVSYLAGCAGAPPAPAPPAPAVPPGTAYKGVTPPVIRGQKPYQINGIWYYPIPSAEGYVETGKASWYGCDFHGLPTACGEPYDMNAMTAAHKILPLGTYVKVTNLQNHRSVIVRINDRGPFVGGRIIDLSYRAASELGSARPGLAHVKVEAVQVASEQVVAGDTYWNLQPVPSFRYGQFFVQIGAFQEQKNADRLRMKMAQHYAKAQVLPFHINGTLFYRVQVGSYEDLMKAQQEKERLRHTGYQGAFVVASEEK